MTLTNTHHESRITNHVGNETRENIMIGNKTTGAGLAFIFALFSFLFIPQAAQAQCGGTTITPVDPVSPSDVDVTCDNGTTIVDITTVLGNASGVANTDDSVQLIGSGSGPVVINNIGGDDFGSIVGGVDVAGNSGDVTLNNAAGSGAWSFRGDNNTTFGSGADTVNNAGLVLTSSHARASVPHGSSGRLVQTIVDFGPGQNAFNNSGTLLVGGLAFGFTGTLTGLTNTHLGPERPGLVSGGPAGETEFNNLDVFHNSGLIVMGGYFYQGLSGLSGEYSEPRIYSSDAAGEAYCRSRLPGTGVASDPPNGYLCTDSPGIEDTDRLTNDVLSLPGTLFTGGVDSDGTILSSGINSGVSTILMDAAFGNGVAQSNCQDRVAGVDAAGHDLNLLPGADCVDLRDGSTDGSTQIVVRDALPIDQGAYNPDGIVIVDVSGAGTSAAEHFTLSPASDYYLALDNGRGSIQKGLFAFTLVYDEDDQQHKLVGIPGAAGLQMPLLAQAAQDLSRRATTSGLDERGNGVRNALRAGADVSGGFWGTVSHDSAERDVTQSRTTTGETFVFNNDFEQDSTALTLGRDFVLGAGDGSAWLVGGSIGYLRGDMSFDATPNDAILEGVAVGLYGGYETGAWFVDAAFNQAFLQVDHFAPAYNLPGDDDRVKTKAQTQGLHLEGGYRLSLTDSLHVEPLASLSWVKADFDDMDVSSPDNPLATSNTVEFGDATSLRGGLGARLSLDTRVSGLNVQYALTGRVWNETDGDADITIKSTGPDATASNTFDGTFTEVQASVGLSNASDSLSGFLNIDSGFGDDYDSLGAELGFRYQW